MPLTLEQSLTLARGGYIPKRKSVAASSSGNNEIVAAVTGTIIVVTNYKLVASGTVSAKWRSANTDLEGAVSMSDTGGAFASDPVHGVLETVAGEALNLNLSGAVAVNGHITYVEV
jgi:hypothetical protein